MLSRAVDRCRDIAIFGFFSMAAAAILDFWNFKLVMVRTVKRVELRHRAKFNRNRWNRGRDMVIFGFFKMAAAAILDFRNFKFLTDGTVKNVELRHLVKFRRNRSNRDWDMWRFFQNDGRPPSWICGACAGTANEGHLVVFICVKFGCGWNRCSTFDIILHVFPFLEFGLKTPEKWVFRGVLTP